MKDWSGKEVKREEPKEDREAAMPLGDPHEYLQQAQTNEYPICPDCGRRHPAAGGPDSMGAYITLQQVKMNAIRSQEAAEIARREFGDNPLIVKVIDAYIGAFIEPEERDVFVEGLLLGLGASEKKIIELEKALARITGLLESFDALISVPTTKPPKKEGKDFGRGW